VIDTLLTLAANPVEHVIDKPTPWWGWYISNVSIMLILGGVVTLLIILPVAVAIGNSFGYHADIATVEAMVREGAGLAQWRNWLLSDTAPAVVIGLFIQSVVAAFVSYFLTIWFWRYWIGRKHRARRHRAAAAKPADTEGIA
jgi:hypothetical protein